MSNPLRRQKQNTTTNNNNNKSNKPMGRLKSNTLVTIDPRATRALTPKTTIDSTKTTKLATHLAKLGIKKFTRGGTWGKGGRKGNKNKKGKGKGSKGKGKSTIAKESTVSSSIKNSASVVAAATVSSSPKPPATVASSKEEKPQKNADTCIVSKNKRNVGRKNKEFFHRESTYIQTIQALQQQQQQPGTTSPIAPSVPSASVVTPPLLPIDGAIKLLLMNALRSCFLFTRMPMTEIDFIVDHMNCISSTAQQSLCLENDDNEVLYVVASGAFKLEKSKIVLQKGDCYGELSIVQGQTRHTTTVTCLKPGDVYAIHRKIFHACQRCISQQEKYNTMQILKQCSLFHNLNSTTLEKIADSTECVGPYYKGHRIIKQGDVGNEFYSIRSGMVGVFVEDAVACDGIGNGGGRGQRIATLKEGDYFGEMSLLATSGSGARTASIICESDNVYCYVLTKRTFTLLLGPVHDIIIRLSNRRKEELNNMKKFLQKRRLQSISAAAKATDSSLVLDEQHTNTIETKQQEESQKDEVTNAINQVEELGIRRRSLVILHRRKQTTKVPLSLRTNTGLQNIDLNDYIDVGKLGEGSFGNVRLVQHKKNQEYFALKMISKAIVEDTRQTENIGREKKLLKLAGWEEEHSHTKQECTTTLSNPSVVTLHGTCSDVAYLYMLFDCIPGGELSTVIHNHFNHHNGTTKTTCTQNQMQDVQFYAGCIVSLLALLHSKSIAFRDLKPENLLIDEDGYLVIVDFGFAKILKNHQKTYTLCGSAEYLAPEVIVRRGHDCSVDYWSLGIIVYEMICGETPFFSVSPRDIFKRILQGDVTFPNSFFGKEQNGNAACRHLILSLLDQTATTRLGALLNGVGDIVDHAFFENFDWLLLAKREIIPSFIPVLSEHGVVALQEESSSSEEEDDEGDEGDEDGKEATAATCKPTSTAAVWEKTWGTRGTEKEWEDW
jgi:serine/threonine protein kinase/CRP-like cAMP-binding protein